MGNNAAERSRGLARQTGRGKLLHTCFRRLEAGCAGVLPHAQLSRGRREGLEVLKMVIGFCTPCMNRRWQIEQTLVENLRALDGTPHFLALCDFNSNDGLDEYVRSVVRERSFSGRLRYFSTAAPSLFHASKAKNVAHRLALRHGAEVLFNLDADNFVDRGTIAAVLEGFVGGEPRCFHEWSMQWGDGSFGRIAMRADSWQAVGGYDEQLGLMAWTDVDLICRARASGLKYLRRPFAGRAAIPNQMRQKVANLGQEVADEKEAGARFDQLNREAMVRSFSRPVIQPLEEQERFPGLLNFNTPATV